MRPTEVAAGPTLAGAENRLAFDQPDTQSSQAASLNCLQDFYFASYDGFDIWAAAGAEKYFYKGSLLTG